MPAKKTEDAPTPAAESPDKAAELSPEPGSPEAIRAEAVAAGERMTKAEAAEIAERGYYERPERWKGIPIFQCASCAYQRAGNAEAVAAHAREAHRPPPPRASGLVAPGGKPLPSTLKEE